MQLNKPMNLCKLTDLEQQAIEDDKARWLTAHNLIRLKPRGVIREWLKSIECDLERDDFKRRLNSLVNKQ